ncbi:DUF3592 domain-containing protein [Aquimarina hainanensis]|uniref:DUF3592 domain-containing protein n=1 Tax=Aquimarina hainanensis TaxID=1578017 RepID=A0ABW5NDQ4_9FLAO
MLYIILIPGFVLLLMSMFFMIVGVHYFIKIKRMIKKGTMTEGKIIGYVEYFGINDEVITHCPKVTFKNKKGKNITARSETGYVSPKDNIGAIVKVLYILEESGYYKVLLDFRKWKKLGYSFLIPGIIFLICGFLILYVNYPSIP